MEAAEIRQKLESTGLRFTPQRYTVMQFLLAHHNHPTAAEIFAAVNHADPRLSRATTYNNLRDLVSAGLVREVPTEGRAARYDATGEQHHHFICDRCGKMEDIPWHPVATPAAGALGKRVVRECELIIRGLCTQCAPRRRTSSAKPSQPNRHN